jgi:chromosome segregation protein
MKIRRLEITGFKSFVERTQFSFDAGISAILGPNGCGKSNVVDAVRWVMGEQSATNLRGQAMGDVIFAGSDSRRAHGMAEVSLIFDNSGTLEHPPVTHPLIKDYAEIMVTRRLYRSGESEYLLNKTPCRLKDITEIFLDTGVGARAYSIIEQGKVASVLQARPEERRILLEEAAGISKYKARRKTALRKIDAAQQNLQRVDDIIAELGERLKGLERQARAAREFRSLRKQARELDIGLGVNRLRELQKGNASLKQAHEQSRNRVQECETDLHQCGLELERCRIARDNADAELAQEKKQMYAWRDDLQECENNSALARQQEENHTRHVREAGQEIQQLEKQLKEDRQRLQALEKECAEKKRQAEQTEHAAAQVRAELQNMLAAEETTRRAVEAERAAQRTAEVQREKLRAKLQDIQREQAVLQERQEHLSEESLRSTAALQLAREECSAAEKHLADCSTRLEKARHELHTAREDLHHKEKKLDAARQSNEKLRYEFQGCESRLESLRELVESRSDVEDSVQKVLQDATLHPDFEGIGADMLKVESEHETAVSAVLGQYLEALCLTAEADAATVLAQLRTRPGFYTCQIPHATQVDTWDEGTSLAQLLDLRGDFCGMLDGIYLVDALEPYLSRKLPPGVTLVTPAGEVLSWQGQISLGRGDGSAAALLRNRRRIAELEQKAAELHQRLQSNEEALAQAHEQYTLADTVRTEKHMEYERQALHEREARQGVKISKRKFSELENGHAKRIEQQKQSSHRLEDLGRELDQLQKDDVSFKEKIDATREKIARMEQDWEQARADLQTCQQRSAECNSSHTAALEQFRSLRRETEHIQRDIRRQEERLHLVRQRQAGLDAEVATLKQQEQELNARTDILLKKLRTSKKAVSRAQQVFDRYSEDVRRLEEQERKRSSVLFRARQEYDGIYLELKHNTEDIERQEQWLEQTYAINPAEYCMDENSLPADAQTRLQRLQRRIEKFGEVNLLAVEEYDALNERYNFLLEQQDDLLRSIADLRQAIARINRKSRSRFKHTFSEVNEQFMRVFPRLFAGGNARLILTEPEDMLTTGVDIEARPPGKKLQNINLLSGGEKALTAVALIFAIFQIKPSPFCILDEVDAPLDHANIGRFNAMLREMAATSQFVIVTHNTRTMEIADTLYGVTMEEPGVSRLVSVDMSAYAAGNDSG